MTAMAARWLRTGDARAHRAGGAPPPPAGDNAQASTPRACGMSHDQNFKNLVLDYPRAALALFAAAEAATLDAAARIVPVRQEQLQERLGERFRELDIPLLVEWPDGRRAALLFVLEEETDPRRFSIHRLAHYCLDLAELFSTERVVPVVIFLRAAAGVPKALRLGGDQPSVWARKPCPPSEALVVPTRSIAISTPDFALDCLHSDRSARRAEKAGGVRALQVPALSSHLQQVRDQVSSADTGPLTAPGSPAIRRRPAVLPAGWGSCGLGGRRLHRRGVRRRRYQWRADRCRRRALAHW